MRVKKESDDKAKEKTTMGKLLNMKEAADRLGVTTTTIRTWISLGYLKAKRLGKSTFVDNSTITALQDTAADTEHCIQELQSLRDKYMREFVGLRRTCENGAMTRRYLNLCVEGSLRSGFFRAVLEILEAVGQLNRREVECLSRRLQGDDLDDIADTFMLTKERIRQIAKKAMRKSCDVVKLKERLEKADALETENKTLSTIVQQMSEKIEFYEKLSSDGRETAENAFRVSKLLSTPLADLGLSVRALNVLRYVREGSEILTLGDLCQQSRRDILKRRNAGKKTITELEAVLEKYGLWWDTDISLLK